MIIFVGPNWTLLSGHCEGQTVSGKENFTNHVDWVHPIDLHYVCKGIQGKIIPNYYNALSKINFL